MQMQNEFRNNVEICFDNLRQELKSEIKALSDKTDVRFEAQAKNTDAGFEVIEKSLDERFDKSRYEIR